MNTLIVFCAEVLIFVASIYSFVRVYVKHEKKHHIRHIVMVLGTASLAWVVAHFLKDYIAHPRPAAELALFLPDDPYSLPSGHAAFMFALACTMYSLDKKAGRVLFVLAVLTGIGRVLSGVHYWYDIAAGAAVGYFISLAVMVVCKRLIRHR